MRLPFKLSAVIFSIAVSTAVHAYSPILAGGTYRYATTQNDSIFIIKTDNNGDSWTTAKSIHGLPSEPRIMLSALACGSKACVAASDYPPDNRNDWIGHLLTSTDAGLTWNVINNEIANLPKDLQDFALGRIDCNNNTCLALGEYTTPDASKPLVLSSKDGGVHWRKENINFPGYAGNVKCTEKYCIVTSSYEKDKNYYPAFLRFDILTNRWSKSTEISGIPDAYHAMFESQISCKDDTCIIAGWDAFKYPGPIAFTSHDQGKTWSFIKNIRGLPKPESYYRLNAASCADNYCVIAGIRYRDYHPSAFAMQSTDGGLSWQVSAFEKISQQSTTSIDAMACDKTTCIISGYATKQNYLIVSHDSGLSWKYIKNLPAIPAEFDAIGLYSNYIRDNNIIAIGHGWMEKNGSKALALVSHDYGNSWTLIQDFNGIDPKATSVFIETMSDSGSNSKAATQRNRKIAL